MQRLAGAGAPRALELSLLLMGCAASADTLPQTTAPMARVRFDGSSATPQNDTKPEPTTAAEAAPDNDASDEITSDEITSDEITSDEEAADADTDDIEFWAPQTLADHMTILHIGDSFAGALGAPLNRELRRRGARPVLEFETGTFISTWAYDKPVRQLLRTHNPDLVLITLGANEVDIRRPERRARTIRRLVSKFRGRRCIWIAPPLWEGARADLLRVIKDNCAPCAYLDSNDLVPNLERLPDKIHPSGPGRTRWAQAVLRWLENQNSTAPDQRWVKW